MSLMGKKQKSTCSPMCKSMKWIFAILLFLVTAASIVGVYETHVLLSSDGSRVALQFGSTSGSLAIIAFVIAAKVWMKQMIGCMSPCEVCSK